MADEKKIGPNVTYVGNDENDKQGVSMLGLRFQPGEKVNLVEKLGQTRAAPVLQKLLGNLYFKVDGGPDRKPVKAQVEEAASKEKEKEGEEDAGEMRLENPPAETSNESGGGRRRGSRGGE
jgi:hypothetical protein